ncbi:MAG: hypothetical protein BMS9Abin37_2522 [Acidobacteriota bacterium]|nr:MAG: hypothetical protein BMS9Abin37_2522 [Acidobacteriota bacterium]
MVSAPHLGHAIAFELTPSTYHRNETTPVHALWHLTSHSYSDDVKTAISIPDQIFKKAERLARRLGISRSQLYAHAVEDYVKRRRPESITEAMNRVVDEVGPSDKEFVSARTACWNGRSGSPPR